jgi:AAHS family benzoate transporter-like MFS transporter
VTAPTTPATPATPARPATPRSRLLVVALCGVSIVVDGYDLIVYGTVVPTFLDGSSDWVLTKDQAGRIGSYALVGMLIGALVVGVVTDLLGRRRIMLICVGWFSAAMALAAMAPTADTFALARFVAGIGLGGVVPTAVALTIEFAPPRYRNTTNGVMFSGYSMGGIAAAVVAIQVIPDAGWRPMFWIGAAAGAALLPIAAFLLPESPTYLLKKGRGTEATAVAGTYGMELPVLEPDSPRVSVLDLFHPRYARATVLFWIATAAGLLLVYGLNTWLAQIMRQAGYDLGKALAFVIVLNLGAIIGTPLLGSVADRIGARPVTVCMFLTASAAILLLSIELPQLALFTLVAIAGACTIGTTILVNSFTALHFPEHMRATALGVSLGVGRLGAIFGPIYGAWILDAQWSIDANFYAFAAPAVVGALAMMAIPRRQS